MHTVPSYGSEQSLTMYLITLVFKSLFFGYFTPSAKYEARR